MRVFFDTVGCRLNQSEMDSLAAEFHAAGDEILARPAQAEVVVLNTCAVTREAERDSRSAARRLHALAPQARLVLTGCWATLAAGEAHALPGVSRVVANAGKAALREGLTGAQRDALIGRAAPPAPRRRTRAFLKVQDGCDNCCTFCVTRLARGASRSRPLLDVLADARELHARGAQEIVLTGVQLGAYGREWGRGPALEGLLRALLEHTEVPRLRLSSLEPWDLAASFFELWANPRLCPHLHLPLQSGASGTLRRMGRRITPEGYARMVEGARRAIPDVAITTDVIVGFPGESRLEFEESLRLVEEMRFADVHAFRFSPRAGTAAARFGDRPVPNQVRARMAMLREVTQASSEAFRSALLGRTLPVLWEREPHSTPNGLQWHGLTHNFQRVQCAARAGLANRILPTRLAALENGVFLSLPATDSSEPTVCQDGS